MNNNMKIQQSLQNSFEVAQYLGNNSALSLISDITEKISNQSYELPLIGQFSAGKSATINHILGREILPTKSIETTAFATFISYAEDEYAFLEMQDGTCENITFEEVKLLDNKMVEQCRKKIASLHIGINSELLKTGLTFIDTPGVNTIITTHIEITERILRNAQYIIYVIAKAITDEDYMMIQTIEAKNIPVVFIRTHIDDIKRNEENWAETVKENRAEIEKKLGHSVRFFAISNIKERTEFEVQFAELMKFLTDEISLKVKEVYENAANERLEPIRKELKNELSTKRLLVEKCSAKSIEEINLQKKQVESVIDNWNTKSTKQQELVAQKVDNIKQNIISIVQKTCNAQISEFEAKVGSSSADVNSLNSMISESLLTASSLLNTNAEQIIQEGANTICKRIGEDFVSIDNKLKDVGLNTDCHFDLSIASDYADRQRALDEEFEEKEAQLQIMKQKVTQQENLSEQQRHELEAAIAQADSEINDFKAKLDSIKNSYEPVYIYKESKLAPIAKTIGNVLDIAMLFIPAKGWTSAGKWIGKIGKEGSKLRKVGSYLQKGAKVLAKTDAAKDATTLIGGLKNAIDVKNGNMKKTSIFDYVSLSYWFEKAGEKIDPSTTILDQDYENMYKAKLEAAKVQLEESSNNRISMIRNLSKINGNEWRIEQEKAEVNNLATQYELEKKRLQDQIETEKKKAIRSSLIDQAKNQFRNKIVNYSDLIIARSEQMVETVFSTIIDAADTKIKTQLSILTSQLDDVLSNRDKIKTNLNREIEKLNEMEAKLKI